MQSSRSQLAEQLTFLINKFNDYKMIWDAQFIEIFKLVYTDDKELAKAFNSRESIDRMGKIAKNLTEDEVNIALNQIDANNNEHYRIHDEKRLGNTIAEIEKLIASDIAFDKNDYHHFAKKSDILKFEAAVNHAQGDLFLEMNKMFQDFCEDFNYQQQAELQLGFVTECQGYFKYLDRLAYLYMANLDRTKKLIEKEDKAPVVEMDIETNDKEEIITSLEKNNDLFIRENAVVNPEMSTQNEIVAFLEEKNNDDNVINENVDIQIPVQEKIDATPQNDKTIMGQFKTGQIALAQNSNWKRNLLLGVIAGALIGFMLVSIFFAIATYGAGIPGLLAFGAMGASALAGTAIIPGSAACIGFLCGFSIGSVVAGSAIGGGIGAATSFIHDQFVKPLFTFIKKFFPSKVNIKEDCAEKYSISTLIFRKFGRTTTSPQSIATASTMKHTEIFSKPDKKSNTQLQEVSQFEFKKKR